MQSADTFQTRTLTASELEHYHEWGWVTVPDVFPVEELATMNQHLDELSAQSAQSTGGSDGARKGWIMRLGSASERTRQFAQDERILNLIQDVVKPGIAIYSAKLVTKVPYTNEICHWHQDDAYYVQYSQSRTRCSTWVPLQDTDERNGCMWIVPGSHRQGLQPYVKKDWGTCNLAINDQEVDLSRAIPLPVKAGSIVIFSALLWHHSKNNQTGQTRRAFIVSYQEATVNGGGPGAQWKILRPASCS
jgi:hypothetical protein